MKKKYIIFSMVFLLVISLISIVNFGEKTKEKTKNEKITQIAQDYRKVVEIDTYITNLTEENIIRDDSYENSEFKDLLEEKIKNNKYLEIADLCNSKNEKAQRCFTEFGVALTKENPKNIYENGKICDKLKFDKKDKFKKGNRTKEKFCGSGLFYTLFNTIIIDQKNKIPSDLQGIVNFCKKFSYEISFPCIQEGSRYVAQSYSITKDAVKEYKNCENIADLLLYDQCMVGVSKGLLTKFNESLEKEITICNNIKIVNYKTKCFSVLGMQNNIEKNEIEKICNLKKINNENCYQIIGVIRNGNNHGDLKEAVNYCYANTDSDITYANCSYGAMYNTQYNKKLAFNEKYEKMLDDCLLYQMEEFYQIKILCTQAVIDLNIVDKESLTNVLNYCHEQKIKNCEQLIYYKIKNLDKQNYNLICKENEICAEIRNQKDIILNSIKREEITKW